MLPKLLRMIQSAQLYFPIAYAHCKRWLCVNCGAIYHTTIAHAEPGAVPGTRHYSIFTRSFIKWARQVCTDSANRVNCSTLFQQYRGDASRINTGEFTFSQILYVHDSYILVRTTFPCLMVHTDALSKAHLTTEVSREKRSQVAKRREGYSCATPASEAQCQRTNVGQQYPAIK